ncbi:unnamed protein product [Mesocestoides corti]|uniref:Mitotic-spindle organizing protein associated with a ring of gamma-tubulin 1 n=1 Tax=Mesocestoides corti TaxID=53468 RepID=A0A0R3UEJ2_MESCO|nr:unnamed protein product [Mesocestoides corti]
MGDFEELAMNAEAFGLLQEISALLNTGLNNEELLMCFKMLESGVDPTALALLVKQLKRDANAVRLENENTSVPSTKNP